MRWFTQRSLVFTLSVMENFCEAFSLLQATGTHNVMMVAHLYIVQYRKT